MMRAARMHSLMLVLAFVAIRCDTHAATPPAALQHHEVRPDRLPKPFATRSAGNPARIVNRPPHAELLLPPGFHIERFADGFDEPRNLLLSPNGDIVVAESAGGRITILRGNRRFVFASDLDRPFGLALHAGYLYVGLESAIVRFPYAPGQTIARNPPERLVSLPPGGHVTRNILFSRDGSQLFVAVGSSGNVNIESDVRRAAITVMKPDGSSARTFASGLRNPVGLALEPKTGALWTTVNERDGLGDELVPDYVTEVHDSAFYGWPYAYIGAHEDPRLGGRRRDLVAKSVIPSVLLESHSAPLGLVFYEGEHVPAGISRPRIRRAAWLVESRDTHRLQGHHDPLPRRPRSRRLR